MNRDQEQEPPISFVFLSYARADFALVNRLKDDLQAHSIRGWIDQTTHLSGSPDEEEDLRAAIRNAWAVVLVLSTQTRRSRSVKEETAIAQMYQRPIYLFWMEGDRLTDVIPTTCKDLPIFDARGQRYSPVLQDLVQVLNQPSPFSTQPLHSEETTAPRAAPRNPYKGLHAFRNADAGDFFGRDRLIDELVEQVRQRLTISSSVARPALDENEVTARLLTILGPSGSGKSSLVMAGLVPRLQQGVLPGSQYWVYPDAIVPGTRPLEALVLALTSLFPQLSPGNILHDLQDDSARGLHVLLASYVKDSDRRIILVIDQFEELFTQTATEEERQHFLDLLLTATTEPRGPLFIILTMRADFYDRLLLYPELGRLVEKHHVTIYPMDVEELRAVIEQPARLPDVQVAFESDLVGNLLFDIRGQIAALPLLQFTLDQLFQRREARMLTLRAYHDIGGVRGALAQHAERIYQSLPTQTHQQLAQALFSRLIDPGTLEADATKRRIPLSAFTLIDPAKTKVLAEVIEMFINERLLTTNTVGEVAMVEVSHEALIGAWNRLQEWLHEAQDAIRLQQAINTDATAWIQHEHPTDRLYRGGQLAEALQWRDTNIPNIDEDAFLQASVKERQRYTRRRILISGGVATGMIGSGLLVYILRATTSPPPIIQKIIQSTPQPKSLPYTYTGHTGLVTSVAWSPDGKRIASADWDNTVQVWDASSGATLFSYKGHKARVNSVAWSPDSKRIASASDDTTVQVWDATNGSHHFSYTGSTSSLYHLICCVAWSPDGKCIASGGYDNTVQIRNATSGDLLFSYTGHTNAVLSIAWSPDGKHIASASDDVQVWDTSSRTTLFSHNYSAESVAWSPDGKYIASADWDKTVRIWDATNGSVHASYIRHTFSVVSVAWSPDGRRIASAGFDSTVQIWNATNGTALTSYTGHTGSVDSVAWSPDGQRIASAGGIKYTGVGDGDKTVQICDAGSSGSRLVNYAKHVGYVYGVAWSPDGQYIASAGDDSAKVWDTSSGTTLFSYTGHTPSVRSVAWSPDGRYIASGGDDKTIQVWDASNGSPLFSYTHHTDSVHSVAWSPDGKRIASAGDDKTVQVWDASSGKSLLSYNGHTSFVYSVAWSPVGRYIASASSDKTVQVWDASSGSLLMTYTGHTSSVRSVAWSPDGKRIASAGDDKTVQVWDASSGKSLLSYNGHTSSVYSVAWSPDGMRITSADGDNANTVQVWNASKGTRLFTYTRHIHTVHNAAWSPDGMRIASASWDGTVQVWWML